ncbi:MAG TPA: hypothetical protein VES39_12150, partial [Rhodospirillales bacterium]|nr:hypothetical protein [Rhodospirillales bacterium]
QQAVVVLDQGAEKARLKPALRAGSCPVCVPARGLSGSVVHHPRSDFQDCKLVNAGHFIN